ncbi:hypothetical protein [Gloeocapsopsis sp. IPPAS B-1203]|uniref:hypothetical protein n=1 Tax=Gloeocapsopsis sp. IPPAS B-1203 TaxID=2049454 RepID=UPI0025A01BDA|nr:hypothetical protein [Gloeocapsopsis sp. IPPAS B-1203]
MVVLHNLADRACSVTLKLQDDKRLIELFGDRQYEPLSNGSSSIPLEAYGYRWFWMNRM